MMYLIITLIILQYQVLLCQVFDTYTRTSLSYSVYAVFTPSYLNLRRHSSPLTTIINPFLTN